MTDEQLWDRALDELAATLDRQQAHLDRLDGGDLGAAPPAPFTADLPPMPASCAARARALLVRLDALTTAVRLRSDEVRPRQAARRPRFAGPTRPSTFVHSA